MLLKFSIRIYYYSNYFKFCCNISISITPYFLLPVISQEKKSNSKGKMRCIQTYTQCCHSCEEVSFSNEIRQLSTTELFNVHVLHTLHVFCKVFYHDVTHYNIHTLIKLYSYKLTAEMQLRIFSHHQFCFNKVQVILLQKHHQCACDEFIPYKSNKVYL